MPSHNAHLTKTYFMHKLAQNNLRHRIYNFQYPLHWANTADLIYLTEYHSKKTETYEDQLHICPNTKSKDTVLQRVFQWFMAMFCIALPLFSSTAACPWIPARKQLDSTQNTDLCIIPSLQFNSPDVAVFRTTLSFSWVMTLNLTWI